MSGATFRSPTKDSLEGSYISTARRAAAYRGWALEFTAMLFVVEPVKITVLRLC